MLYQPIISLKDGAIYGYEALSRGPVDSIFHSPMDLFGYAEQSGNLYALERLSREKAVKAATFSRVQQKLFINISAAILEDPRFMHDQTLSIPEQTNLCPSDIVFEITERNPIEDFSGVKRVLDHYRKQGYQFAIDDAGAGYSSLQAIAELYPDYIKMDRSLVQNIHKDKLKESIMESFVTITEKMNIHLIAEGVETMDDLSKVARMGVHYVQGYLLSRPSIHPVVYYDELARALQYQIQ